jgi:cysteine desulfurase/selenocysteine lyase
MTMASATSPSPDAALSASLRAEFPVTKELAYFATGNVNAPPRSVTEALYDFTVKWAARGDEVFAEGLLARDEAKALFAEIIGARADDIALVKNTTEGIALAAHMIDPKPGENVVVDELCIQTNVYPWRPFERRGVHIRVVPARDERILVDDYAQAIDNRTCAVSLCYVTMKTGFRVDVPAIAKLAHDVGALMVVDVAQAAGAVPVNISSLNADVIVCPTYKWLFGPAGMGFAWFGERLRESPPPMPGWNAVVDPELYDIGQMRLRPDAQRFESGMFPLSLCGPVAAGLRHLIGVGLPTAFQFVSNVTSTVYDALVDLEFQVRTPAAAADRAGLVFFESEDTATLGRALQEASVRVVPLLGGIRVDCALFNDDEDVLRLRKVLERFNGRARS